MQPSCKVQGPGSVMSRPRTREPHLVPALQVPRTLGQTQWVTGPHVPARTIPCGGSVSCPPARSQRPLEGRLTVPCWTDPGHGMCKAGSWPQPGRLLEPGKPGTGPRLG